ncbi:hypothetical protein HPB49_018992 [Dermacentor silvarum]|uniref:Uncharacterized protein n=1 Tax=Dermacentor silvarum TaxID=543639 RepID=A0ACB8E357_DERSI|nr:baculoviral IAP repeat-containing protein 5 [Dermacentor silvarum]KAH7980759.1 hypothetical protein HPB49_018992 [Dermacentor silvarum]
MAEARKPREQLSLESVLRHQTDAQMNLYEQRVASFTNWPLPADAECTPARMAEAGFYHCPTEDEPDLARCYVCLKQMSEWKPSDDPRSEHARSTNCDFLNLGKKPQDITAREFLALEAARYKNKARKFLEMQEEELQNAISDATRELQKVRNRRR